MRTKSFLVISVISFAIISLLQAQSPSPAESPAAEKKHRTHKKAETAASPAESATSPSAAESPAASPKPKRGRKAKTTAAAPVSPSPSPAKKTLADYFKPKTSASPAAATAPAGTGAAAAGAAAQATPARVGGHGLVWVNSETHIYHKEGSRFYGNTTHGKYVSEADAVKEGDRPAKGE